MADDTPDVEWKVSHDSLASALVHALADLTVIEKGQTANLGTYSYSYADLADVVKRTRPVLARHGLVALTPLHSHGTDMACSVVFVHEGGERMDFGPFPFPHGRDAQATGSMVTYMRRYALVAALGMAAGDDDDGAAAQPRQASVPAPAVMQLDEAKELIRTLAEGDTDLAKAAWIDLYQTPWTVDALTAAFKTWVTTPKDDPGAGEATGNE